MAKKPKSSKFEEMLAKAKVEKKERDDAIVVPAIPQAELDALLKQVETTVEAVKVATQQEPVAPVVEVKKEVPKEDYGPYATKAQQDAAMKSIRDVLHPQRRKAYNIWFNETNRMYMLDTLEYEGEVLLLITSKVFTTSQALAMAKVKEIYTQKLILRRGNV